MSLKSLLPKSPVPTQASISNSLSLSFFFSSSPKDPRGMTNQRVVITETKSKIGMALTAAMSKSGLISPAVREPMARIGELVALSQKKFLKKLENGASCKGSSGAKVTAWVDAMRDSSPTKLRPISSFSETTEQSSWALLHPSALHMFEEITKASQGKQIVMFLDYDGTLSPIVEDPDRAFMTHEMREAVKNVARYFPTAIVSGRSREKVYSFVQLSELYYAGSHGMDIKGPSKTRKHMKGKQPLSCQPAIEFLPMIDEVYKALCEKIAPINGAMVENNRFCISVHFRCVDEKNWSALAEKVRSVVNEYPKLRMSQGRKVLEIRPTIKWDKGKALEFLLESLGFGNSKDVLPVYIGDDRTDEDAFEVLRSRKLGFGILVSKSPKETRASHTLQEPSEVKEFLSRLVEWRRNNIRHTGRRQ